MSTDAHEALSTNVLAWINKVREEYKIGEPLDAMPRARSGYFDDVRSKNCPIAVALGASWGYGGGFLADGTLIVAPGFVRTFVRAVDNGKYPELLPEAA